MRLSTLELYGLDAKDFVGVPHEIVLLAKIDACFENIERLYEELKEEMDYETVQGINYQIKYREKAKTAMMQDYSEMGFTYERKNR